jgi:predicted DsbA family dithiol-disulfide isomerase
MHDHAMDAALAMQAAREQGKAWKMHDMMFEHNHELARTDLERFAQDLGLDMTRFKHDFDDPAIKKHVLDDQAEANKLGVQGTPTLFVNGQKVIGAKPFEEMKVIIDEEIKKADALLAKGVPLAEIYEKLAKGGS